MDENDSLILIDAYCIFILRLRADTMTMIYAVKI